MVRVPGHENINSGILGAWYYLPTDFFAAQANTILIWALLSALAALLKLILQRCYFTDGDDSVPISVPREKSLVDGIEPMMSDLKKLTCPSCRILSSWAIRRSLALCALCIFWGRPKIWPEAEATEVKQPFPVN